MISQLAYVSKEAKLGENVIVHPFAHIDANVEIGDNCEIYPYASIVSGSRIARAADGKPHTRRKEDQVLLCNPRFPEPTRRDP